MEQHTASHTASPNRNRLLIMLPILFGTAIAASSAGGADQPIDVMPLVEALEKAGTDDGAAFFALAIHQARGRELERNRDKAYSYLMQAVEAGYPPALYALAYAREGRLKAESVQDGEIFSALGVYSSDLLKSSLLKGESLLDGTSAEEILGLYQRAADKGLALASNGVERIRGKIASQRRIAEAEERNRERIVAAFEKAKKEHPGTPFRPSGSDTYAPPPLLAFDKAAALAEKGDPDGYYMLAVHYAQGNVVEQDRQKAYAFLSKAAAGDHPAALYLLGCTESRQYPQELRIPDIASYSSCSFQPPGRTVVDFGDDAFVERVTRFFVRADELGVAGATNAVVRLRKWHDEIVAKRAAKQENERRAKAIEALVPPEFPRFEPMPFAEAVKKAAKGDADAYCSLAVHYARGKDVVQDRAKAKACLEKAVELSSPFAMLLLGAVKSNDSKVAETIADVSPYAFGSYWRPDSDEEEAGAEALALYGRARDKGLPQATNAIARLQAKLAKQKAEKDAINRNEEILSASGLNLPSESQDHTSFFIGGEKIDPAKMREWDTFFKSASTSGKTRRVDADDAWAKLVSAGTAIVARVDLKLFSANAIPARAAELAQADGYVAAWRLAGESKDAATTWSADGSHRIAIMLGADSVARFSEDGTLLSIQPAAGDPWFKRAKDEIDSARARQAAGIGLPVASCEMLAEWLDRAKDR